MTSRIIYEPAISQYGRTMTIEHIPSLSNKPTIPKSLALQFWLTEYASFLAGQEEETLQFHINGYASP